MSRIEDFLKKYDGILSRLWLSRSSPHEHRPVVINVKLGPGTALQIDIRALASTVIVGLSRESA